MIYLLLFVIELLLFAVTYVPGTTLAGWDNLMPEFNTGLNLKRAFFGVWQEYRGLGLLDGLSHTATLMHTLYIAALEPFLPRSALRYAFVFLSHAAGGAAFFALAKRLTKNMSASFIGAIFYMFNLGVVQMFFAPLEVFAFHFAALPLVALFATKALELPSRKNMLLFALVTLLLAPQGFVPTLFLVFLFFLGSLLFFQALAGKTVRSGIILGIIFLSVNAFWLLPWFYSAKHNAAVIPATRINKFSSEEIFYRNRAFGDLNSVLKLQGFMMDTVEYDSQAQKNDYFIDSWRKHSKSIPYQAAYLAIFATALLGLFTIFKQRADKYYGYIASFFFSLFFLANNTPVFAQLNDLLRRAVPVFGEAFRFPFTKFILLFTFALSLFLAVGVQTLLKRFKPRRFVILTVFLVCIGLLTYPALRGQFVSTLLRVRIPEEYSRVMDYFNTQDENKRIALLPAHTFWNWQYYRWGYRGSGFLWYGLKQPLLIRSFDPWSLENERFYDELSSAINKEDVLLLRETLMRYDIAYLLLDTNILNNLSTKPINYDKLQRFLAKIPSIKKKAQFDTIQVYETGVSGHWATYAPEKQTTSQPVFSSQLLSEDKTTITFAPADFSPIPAGSTLDLPNIFSFEGLIPVRFVQKINSAALEIVYPEIWINNKKLPLRAQTITIASEAVTHPDNIRLTDINHSIKPGELGFIRNSFKNTLRLDQGTAQEFVTVDTRGLTSSYRVRVNEPVVSLVAKFPKIKSPYSFTNLISKRQYEVRTPPEDIVVLKGKDSFVAVDEGGIPHSATLTTKKNAAELVIWKDNLPHDASYYLRVDAEHRSGLPASLYVDNPFEKRSEFETRLSKDDTQNSFILPPTQQYFKGYGFHLVVKSVGNEKAESTFHNVSIYPVPGETIKHVQITTSALSPDLEKQSELFFTKKTPYRYEVRTDKKRGYIILSQAFHKGWKAYKIKNYESRIMNYGSSILPFLFGEELHEHVKINGWANGWAFDLPQDKASDVVIVFWPQYLEYIGFFLMIITLIIITTII